MSSTSEDNHAPQSIESVSKDKKQEKAPSIFAQMNPYPIIYDALHKSVVSFREFYNQKLDELYIPIIPSISNIEKDVSKKLYDTSEWINTQYQYPSQIARTHGALISTGTVLFVALSPIKSKYAI